MRLRYLLLGAAMLFAAPASSLLAQQGTGNSPQTPAQSPRTASAAQAPEARFADLVLRNGNVLTVDDHFSRSQAVAIRDGRIVAVGTNGEVDAMAGPDTKVLDLGGRTVIPGLLDNHVHLLAAALNAAHVSLLDARSIADVQQAIRERAKTTPEGQWIRGSSVWHEIALREGRLPTRWELDEAAPNHPVYIQRGGHVAAVNSRALALAGITRDTPDPENGVIGRTPDGEPTGILLQGAARMMARVLPPPPSVEEQAELLRKFMQQLNSYGVVGVVEPGLSPAELAVYDRLRVMGQPTLRTHALYRVQSEADVDAFLEKYQRGRDTDDFFRMGGVKYPLDGGVEGAYLKQPYQVVAGEQPNPDYHGAVFLPPGGVGELERAFRRVADAGWQLQIHTVGDAAIDTALDIFEKVDQQTRIEPLRWALMHVFLPSDEALQRMKRMGVLATVQDHPLLLGHNQLRYWGAERAASSVPIRSLLDAGINVSGGSDASVLPGSPFVSMAWMTDREMINGKPLGPEQAITRAEALRLWTRNSAYLMGLEDRLGSIEVGKYADLVVLPEDPLTAPAERLKTMKAELTLVEGRPVYGSLENWPAAARPAQ